MCRETPCDVPVTALYSGILNRDYRKTLRHGDYVMTDGLLGCLVREDQALALCLQNRIVARPARFELTTSGFGGQRSIQLSYGRVALL